MIEILLSLFDTVMDCIESCVEDLVLVSGKKMLRVLYFEVALLILVSILGLFDISTFVSWQEGLMATSVVSILCLIAVGNKDMITKFKSSIKEVKEENGNRNSRRESKPVPTVDDKSDENGGDLH